LFKEGLRYNTSYKVVSDWILTNDAFIFQNCSTRYIDLVICCFEDPGISNDFSLRQTERKRYFKENFDPMFLRLLKDYQILNNQHLSLKNGSPVKMALWMHQKKRQLVQYFKKQS
jgi:hypothetical protein